MHETVFKEVNVGYGHVDQHMYPSGSAVYPVEQLYVQQNVVPGQEEKEADMKTTQRMSYKPRCDLAQAFTAVWVTLAVPDSSLLSPSVTTSLILTLTL